MEFEEEKYEIKSTSDYWADVVRGKEKYDNYDEPEEEFNTSKPIFICSKCRFTYDLNNPPMGYYPFEYYISKTDNSKIKCPKCGKVVAFETITKEKYDELIKKASDKKRKQEEKEKQRKKEAEEREKEEFKEDMSELTEDLEERLASGEIIPQRFVAIFTHMAMNIRNRYKNLDIDLIEYRKTIFALSDKILKVNEEKRISEEILEGYTEDIEQDELYKAELDYYIEDNKYAIPDYELKMRIKEYEKLQRDIRGKEYKRDIEEKYQERRTYLLQKAEERERRQKLRDIM